MSGPGTDDVVHLLALESQGAHCVGHQREHSAGQGRVYWAFCQGFFFFFSAICKH